MSQVEALPFGLLHRDQTPMADRGYEEYPSIVSYDPKTQISVFSPRAGGPTTPTTRSLVAGTTGGLLGPSDSDEANDDKGTD
jgi:hypothetical protein